MHRLTLKWLPVMLVALAVALPAAADQTTPSLHYRWKDAAGVIHFGDTIPASALPGGYEIVNNEGRVVRRIARELTPAERAAAAKTADEAAAQRRTQQQQHLEDVQLLAAYPTDKDLERAQQAQLRQIQLDINALQNNLSSQEESLTELLSHAADLQHAHKPVPPAFNQRIAEQRDAVNNERHALVQRRADYANAKARFANQLQRYLSLRAKYDAGDAQ